MQQYPILILPDSFKNSDLRGSMDSYPLSNLSLLRYAKKHTMLKKHLTMLLVVFVYLSLAQTLTAQTPVACGSTLTNCVNITGVGPGEITFDSGNGTVCNGRPPGFEIWIETPSGCIDVSAMVASTVTQTVPTGPFTIYACHPQSTGNPRICNFIFTPSCESCSDPIMQACDDGDDCTENDMEGIDNCDDTNICIPCAGTPITCENGPTTTLPCDDGDPCTEGETETTLDCDGSICIPCGGGTVLDCGNDTTILTCDDGDDCTVGETITIRNCDDEVCVPCGGGTPIGCGEVTFQPCNDGNPCTLNDQVGINSCGEVCMPCMGTEQCRPFPCDDGNPCTFNDRVLIGCDGRVCEPCTGTMEMADKDGDGVMDCEDECPHNPNKSKAGDCGCEADDDDSDGDGVSDCEDECPDNPNTSLAGACGCDAPGIIDVSLANASGCNDNGTSDPSDDFFIADIVVTFNFAPELGGIDITGPVDVYYNFENGNKSNVITIPDQVMPADGKPISIIAAYRGNEACNACVHVGSAPSGCSSTPCVHPDYGTADPSGTCITDITLSKISKCHDSGTGVYKADDFVYANVTVHLDGAPKGNLVLDGMANGKADVANHSGSSYTFSRVKLYYNQGGGNLKAYIVDRYDSSNVLCSYHEGGFECDPCTTVNYGSRIAQTQLPIINNDLSLGVAGTDLSLTPNPAINEVLISNLAPAYNEGRIELKVFDATGQLHIAQTLTARDNIRLNVDALTNGVYLIQVSNQSVIQTARLMKVQ